MSGRSGPGGLDSSAVARRLARQLPMMAASGCSESHGQDALPPNVSHRRLPPYAQNPSTFASHELLNAPLPTLRPLCGRLLHLVRARAAMGCLAHLARAGAVASRLVVGRKRFAVRAGVVGAAVPGPRASEAYMKLAELDVVYHMDRNPKELFDWQPARRAPPLLDRHVVPLAFRRPSPAKFFFDGTDPVAVVQIFSKELPATQPMSHGPKYEWYGVLADDSQTRLEDAAAYAYLGFVRELTYDALVGIRSGHEQAFQTPRRHVRIEYSDGTVDVLELGAATRRDRHLLCNTTTEQVFVVSARSADRLFPDHRQLLEKTGK